MEPEGIPILSNSSPSPPHDDLPDLSSVGSPVDTQLPEDLPPPSDEIHVADGDDLRRKIIKQVEYYFSDENLPTDKFLMKYVTKDADGFVPIGVIASFRKMKKLTKDTSLIVAALRESALLVVSSSGKKVKRLHPLPITEIRDPMICTVSVENLPEDHSVENLRKIFGEVGNIKSISIHDPQTVKEPRKCTVAEKLLSGKLHALVEYDTVDAAEKAVATLNNEQDWRFGLRVKFLKKRSKPGQRKSSWREADSDKNSRRASDETIDGDDHYGSENHDESHDEEVGDHIQKEKTVEYLHRETNAYRDRNRGRGRRHKRGSNGQGQGAVHSGHVEPSKPPPGPRMPDGTRGFTMGRGRPLAPNPS